jgi:hypothetical protein
MHCAGSINAERGYVDQESQFAYEGTIAHWVLEQCLTFDTDACDYIGMKTVRGSWHFEWADEDADFLQPIVDEIREIDGTVYPECCVDLSKWLGKGQKGTSDVIIIPRKGRRAILRDLKYGRGIPVSPVENEQAMLYSLGAWDNIISKVRPDITEFTLIIDQPRCTGGGGEWTISLDELLAFGEKARAAAKRTRDPNAPRTASASACMWCKAKDDCAEYNAFNLAMLGAEFEDLDAEELLLPADFTMDRRAKVHLHRSMIEKWLKHNDDILLAAALAGDDAGGLKAIAGRRMPAKWQNAEAAETVIEALIGERAFTKRLISPTQASKQISHEDMKAMVDPLITRGEAKPTLVSVLDDRPALIHAELYAAEFDDLD